MFLRGTVSFSVAVWTAQCFSKELSVSDINKMSFSVKRQRPPLWQTIALFYTITDACPAERVQCEERSWEQEEEDYRSWKQKQLWSFSGPVPPHVAIPSNHLGIFKIKHLVPASHTLWFHWSRVWWGWGLALGFSSSPSDPGVQHWLGTPALCGENFSFLVHPRDLSGPPCLTHKQLPLAGSGTLVAVFKSQKTELTVQTVFDWNTPAVLNCVYVPKTYFSWFSNMRMIAAPKEKTLEFSEISEILKPSKAFKYVLNVVAY